MTDNPQPPTPIRRIAIYRALFLGDLLCTVPAFRALRQGFPDAEITLIGLPWARAFVDRMPYLDHFCEFPGYSGIEEVPYDPAATERFLAAARAARYDLAFQMHGDGSVSNGFVAELGARRTVGYRRADDDRLDLGLLHEPEEHEVLRWLRLVGSLGIAGGDPRLEFPTSPAERRRAAKLLRAADGAGAPGPLVGLHPGAKDPARRWPPERWAALADALALDYDARIVLTGGDAERPITAAVKAAMRSPALDLAGQTGLGEFAAAIARLDLLVSNDTGASHIAAATRTPSVILFGPSRPHGWAPLDRERHRVVDALDGKPDGYDPALALQALPVGPALAVCSEMLAPPRERPVAAALPPGGRERRLVATATPIGKGTR